MIRFQLKTNEISFILFFIHSYINVIDNINLGIELQFSGQFCPQKISQDVNVSDHDYFASLQAKNYNTILFIVE